MSSIAIYAIMEIPVLYELIGVRIETMLAGFQGGGKSVSDASTLQRIAFTEYGLEQILKRPLLGYGPNSFIYMYGKSHPDSWIAYSHNNFIEIAFSIGIIGLIIYYYIYIVTLKTLWKHYKKQTDNFALLLFSLLIGIMTIHYGWVAYYSIPNNLMLTFAVAYAYLQPKHIIMKPW